MPGAAAVDKGRVHALKFDPVPLQPVDRLCRLLEPVVECLTVDAPMVKVHHAFELLFDGQTDVVLDLKTRADGKRAFHVISAAPDHGKLFEDHRLKSGVHGGHAGTDTARAGADDAHVNRHRAVGGGKNG